MKKALPRTDDRGVVVAFQSVCEEFQALSRSWEHGTVPVWGGTWSFFKYMLRHPLKGYTRTVKDGYRAQARVGTLTPFFPLEAMVASLSRYSEPQLRAIKRLSEVQVRRAKAMITDNPAVKLGVPLGSAYGLLEVGSKFVATPGSASESLREIVSSPVTQEIMGYLLIGFLFMVLAFAIQYLFVVGPMIGRAELLNDVLLVALEEKAFAGIAAPSMDRARETVAPHAVDTDFPGASLW